MQFIADFHLHSKYSRATSKDMDLENLVKWAKIKGIKILGSGDFTHPDWIKSLKETLEPVGPGLFKLRNNSETRFVLTSEISCIYSKAGKVRKIHIIIFAPSFEIVEKINTHLSWIGNLRSDGRPILGLDARELAKIVLNTSKDCLIVPAHLMTPWFSLFGSKSGFDSIEECFGDYSEHIYAGETGLSASPDMLWRMPDGRRITLISNSDAHSPAKLGREANIFEGSELSYQSIITAIKGQDQGSAGLKLISTIEFFPQEGKYHYDGHRLCGVSFSPQESKKTGNICPNCGKPLTIGVLNRVDELADRPEGFKPESALPFKSLVPLEEIIANALGVMSGTKQAGKEYDGLIDKFGSEFNVLLGASRSELESVTLPEIAEGIIRVREGKVYVKPGYDGVYGTIRIFSEGEQKTVSKQKTLF
jgi:DNA helicase-2/ATP-dependent DNA helicase PcrA